MNNVIFLSEKNWHKNIFDELVVTFKSINWHYIDKKSHFTLEIIVSINPCKIFIPHWSYIIPESIFKNYECIVFHMTDLPFGRGGSPLQNLIVRGFKETMITAIKVEKGIDTGDIYIKKPLNLSGTAYEIFLKSILLFFLFINQLGRTCQIG